jgi:hypothetical protein
MRYKWQAQNLDHLGIMAESEQKPKIRFLYPLAKNTLSLPNNQNLLLNNRFWFIELLQQQPRALPVGAASPAGEG